MLITLVVILIVGILHQLKKSAHTFFFGTFFSLTISKLMESYTKKKYSAKGLTDKQCSLMAAIEKRDLEAVKSIVKRGCDVNFFTTDGIVASPLYLACFLRDLEMVKWLVNEGNANVSQDMVSYFALDFDTETFAMVDFLQKYLDKKAKHT